MATMTKKPAATKSKTGTGGKTNAKPTGNRGMIKKNATVKNGTAKPANRAASSRTAKNAAALRDAEQHERLTQEPKRAAKPAGLPETLTSRQMMAATGKGKSRISQLCNPDGDKPAVLKEGQDWRFERTQRVFMPKALTKLLKEGEDYEMKGGKLRLHPRIEKAIEKAL